MERKIVPSDEQVFESLQLVISTFASFRKRLLHDFGTITFTRKSDGSVVTEWDVSIETKLREVLQAAFPTFGFQGEETGTTGSAETYWLVDPIDGTSSFIRGLQYTTNMAALVHNGETIAAIVYDFVLDVSYTAIKGKGAWRNGVSLRVNTLRKAGNLVVYVSGKRHFPLVREALDELGMRIVQPMGGAGHAYTLLAQGKIDGVVNLWTTMGAYDNAPGVLIAEEAGAVVLPYDDKTGVERHEFIIGSPYVVDAIEKSGLL